MNHVILPLAEGFEEIEAVTLLDILRRADIETTPVSLDGETLVRGSRDLFLKADSAWDESAALQCDALVLPGGMGGTRRLAEHTSLLEILRQRFEFGKLVGAICAGPLVLQKAGILGSKTATCHPDCRDAFAPGTFSADPVVYDPPVITSRGPGTAMRFALELVERLAGREIAGRVAAGLVL